MRQDAYYGETESLGGVGRGPVAFPPMGDSFRGRLEFVREKKRKLMDDMVRLTGEELALAHILGQA